MDVIFRELSALYQAFKQGEPSPLSPLPIQYADFAHWQRSAHQTERHTAHLNYWRKHLADAVPLLELPTDHPRPAVQSFSGASHHFTLPDNLTDAVKKLANQAGTTLFMVLQAAFAVLLYRYSNQDDILVGLAVANRDLPEVEPLIGFFADTLVLRSDLSGNPTFRTLLAQIRQRVVDAFQHKTLPFEQIVEALQPERVLSYSPLFQVAFSWEHAQADTPNLIGLKVTRLPEKKAFAKFDLTLFMQEMGQRIYGEWEYNTVLFEEKTIERLTGHFETLLHSIVANPEQSVAQLPLLTAAERYQMLVKWPETATDYPRDKGLHHLFEEQVERTPDAIALVFGQTQLTYTELNVRANQLAHYLQGLGVKPGLSVGLQLARSPELIISIVAILKAGAVYTPIDLAYPQARLLYICQDADLSFLLTQTPLDTDVSMGTTQRIQLDTIWPHLDTAPRTNLTRELVPFDARQPLYVMYTSGSTGQPKGILIPHQAVARLVLNTNYVALSIDDCMAHLSNIAFDAATFEVWGALLNGAKLVILPKEVALLPAALAAEISAWEITTIFVTTALFNQLVREKPDVFASVKQVLFGGEAVNPHWVRTVLENKPPQRLLHVYGPTENTTFTSWYLVKDVPSEATTVPIGQPIANTQLYILDEQAQAVPVGVPGELYIGGDGLALGYLNRPDLSAEKFIVNPYSNVPEAKLYKTGDLVRYLSDGNIEFIGRTDHQVKVRGFRIELGEIETALAQHPLVRETVVIVREDQPDHKEIVAYVVVSKRDLEVRLLRQQLHTHLGQRLPKYMIPTAFVLLDAGQSHGLCKVVEKGKSVKIRNRMV